MNKAELESGNYDLRVAMLSAMAIMLEDAQDCDGFTDRQIELIKKYAPVVGIELVTRTDEWGDPIYHLVPSPALKLAEIKREQDARHQKDARREARNIRIAFLMITIGLALALGVAAVLAILTNGG